jgi:hypothetical protein
VKKPPLVAPETVVLVRLVVAVKPLAAALALTASGPVTV